MRLACRLFGHDWKHVMTVGEDRASRCERGMCPEYKVERNGVALPAKEAKERREEMYKSARAMMWILDNVQPTYSSDGTGTAQQGEPCQRCGVTAGKHDECGPPYPPFGGPEG